jgi:hypothetical protein
MAEGGRREICCENLAASRRTHPSALAQTHISRRRGLGTLREKSRRRLEQDNEHGGDRARSGPLVPKRPSPASRGCLLFSSGRYWARTTSRGCPGVISGVGRALRCSEVT